MDLANARSLLLPLHDQIIIHFGLAEKRFLNLTKISDCFLSVLIFSSLKFCYLLFANFILAMKFTFNRNFFINLNLKKIRSLAIISPIY